MAHLREAGLSATALAPRLGVSRQHVCNVIHRRRRNSRIERAIARAIGRPVAEVFPKKD
ncbi:helix-turn-helix domain-containing protein [Arenimonas sp.]|uniref:helix-turn-helix domain-containing protein n=1 Tax=Arenimonas sp. TaxID=1872635 RepID=UPI0025C0A7B0|nr:helix-turn-helix domain-containing protein [Arenimonas sp.]